MIYAYPQPGRGHLWREYEHSPDWWWCVKCGVRFNGHHLTYHFIDMHENGDPTEPDCPGYLSKDDWGKRQ